MSSVDQPLLHLLLDGQPRKRKSGLTQADDFKNAKKVITYEAQLVDSMTTDFNKSDAYQSCAAFTKDGTRLATAGADGHVRVWKVVRSDLFFQEMSLAMWLHGCVSVTVPWAYGGVGQTGAWWRGWCHFHRSLRKTGVLRCITSVDVNASLVHWEISPFLKLWCNRKLLQM